MNMLFRILSLLVISAAGFLAVPFVINLMIWGNLIDTATVASDFLQIVIQKAIFVWIGAAVLGVISLFIKQSWSMALLFAPLFLPIIYTIGYALIQS